MEAETKMRAKGKGGMTDAEVVDFVDRYMPAYKARAYKAPGLLLATEQLLRKPVVVGCVLRGTCLVATGAVCLTARLSAAARS